MGLKTRTSRLMPGHFGWIVFFLLGCLDGSAALAFEASFDCAKAATHVERMICADPLLAVTDQRMAEVYGKLRQVRPETVQEQRQWLQERNACGDAACLGDQYQRRFNQFIAIAQAMKALRGQTAAPAQAAPPVAPAPAAPVAPPPENTVSLWQQAKDFIETYSRILGAALVAALAYALKRCVPLPPLAKRWLVVVSQSRFYRKASGLAWDFGDWLERLEEEKPVAALLGVLAVLFLSTMAAHVVTYTLYQIILWFSNKSFFYHEPDSYWAILGDVIEYALVFFALFTLARVPFYAGLALSLALDTFGKLSSYPAVLFPLALETGLITYVALYQRETILAWAVKWNRRKKAQITVLGWVVFLGLAYLAAQFAATRHGGFAEALVWIVAAVLVGIWIKKRRRSPETSLFDATLEPEKYFRNEGAVLGWCYCALPEPGGESEEDEEPKPRGKAAQVVRYKTDKHFLSIMPNRSGKGRSQIIPNLLQLADWSCWVIDPKGENALVTAQWRRDQGHEIVIFNPYGLWADEFKARGFESFQTFNPLLNLDPESDRFIGDVDTLADALVYSTGGDAHWSEGARGLVSLLIMYLVTEPTETPTFRRLRELIAGGRTSLNYAFGLMSESPCDLVRENVGRYDKESKETDGLIATAETQTNIFRNKTLCRALEGGAFDFEAMKRRKMTVYMILPAEYLVTQARYLRLVLLSAMAQFTRSEEGQHRIMVLLDEFANLGPLQMVEQGAALISGYGVTLWPFVQNLSQLQKLYPNNWEVFIANAAAITVANVNDVTTAEYFSKRAGKTIKHLWSWSSSSTSGEKPSSTSGHSKSESIQDILPVEDIYNLDGWAGYVFFEGKAPPLIVLKSNYDDKRLPWSYRAADNPMVKAWR